MVQSPGGYAKCQSEGELNFKISLFGTIFTEEFSIFPRSQFSKKKIFNTGSIYKKAA